jgi:selenocysteine lyase/cysteine desulfurase
VIPIQLKHVPHFLAAAVLGYEFGIGVRSGCFCAHPYILHLLGLNNEEAGEVRRRMVEGDKSEMPGLIRASFGLYNTRQEVDILVNALQRISTGEYKGKYTQDKASGEYSPLDWQPKFSDFFSM